MPRVSRAQAETNRQAITDASARLIRERGIDGVSVSDLMSAAGLTHGGFYGHFESKDALAGAACSRAFEQSIQRWGKRVSTASGTADALITLIENYLSARSRDNPGSACPTAALAGDVARLPRDAAARGAYRAGVEHQIEMLSSLQKTGDATEDRAGALVEFATMVGALVLSRATAGDTLSDEFLAAARRALIAGSRAAPTDRRPPKRK